MPQAEPIFLERESFVVAGISGRASNAEPQSIGALWQKFYGAGGPAQIHGRLSDEVYALYTDYESDHNGPYTLILGCQVPSVDGLGAGLVARTIPTQRYAVFEATGEQPATLIAGWQRVWQAPIKRAFTVDFDRHRDAKTVQIHVAVR